MTIIQSIILGILQGFTEFLPISSSAHLYIIPYFFNWGYQGLGFDVALHWGTLLSVVIIFWKDYWKYFKGLWIGGIDRAMAWFLVLGSIPAAVIGFLLQGQAESVFRSPWVIFVTLTAFALLLWVADKKSTQNTVNSTQLGWKKVLFIGFAQAIAIIPGVSRSGVTMTAGMFSRLTRAQAVRFSFLLSGPIIFGAGLVSIPDVGDINTALIVGFLASVVSGFIAIKFLLKFITTHSFNLFVFYRYALAVLIFIILLIR